MAHIVTSVVRPEICAWSIKMQGSSRNRMTGLKMFLLHPLLQTWWLMYYDNEENEYNNATP
jgi:hypothetical protein